MKYKKSIASKIFDISNYIFLLTFALLTILPLIYVISGSFASELQLSTESFFLIPKSFNLDAYKYILSSNTLPRSFYISVFITVVGTAINLLFTVTMAYPLSRSNLYGRNVFINMVIFTMLFNGGMIPTYLVVKNLGLLNSFWALMLPVAINPFNLIVVKSFFQDLPKSLQESAIIDGCTELGVLVKIVLPLSLPVLAAIGLFYAVSNWNSFFNALIYMNDTQKWPLQVILRQIIMLSQSTVGDMEQLDLNFVKPPEQSVKMAVIVFATVPILSVYPFLQKYFTKGVMIGAVKG